MDHSSVTLLTDIGLGIVFAALASHLARVLRQPLILGYVLGGVLLGSQIGFGLVTNEASIELISEIGLILLLFIIGLEIDVRELVRMGRGMFVIGVAQFGGCVLLGLAFFSLLPAPLGEGRFDLLYLAVALALSSTLIVVKLLHDKFEVHTKSGSLTVAILVIQDIWAILFMAFQPNLLHPAVGGILKSLGQGAVLVVLAFVASRYLLSRLFRAAAKSPELILLSSIAWCFIVCGLAERAGLSKEMGSLIAGLSIAAFPYGADVTAKLGGIRDFFVTLFFVSLGLKVPLPSLASLGISFLVVGFVVASRLLSVVPAVYLTGLGLRTGVVSALNLAQVSEFSLVIMALGAGYGHVSGQLQSVVLTSMLLAAVVSTYLILFNDFVARRILGLLSVLGLRDAAEGPGAKRAEAGRERRDIVILGCFWVGEALLDEIDRNGPALKPRILVVDFNPQLRERLARKGFTLAYGDLAHPQTLHHLGIEDARVIVCTISDTFLKGITARSLLSHLKQMAPDARIMLTADDPAHARVLLEAGAAEVVVPGRLAGARFFSVLSGAVESA